MSSSINLFITKLDSLLVKLMLNFINLEVNVDNKVELRKIFEMQNILIAAKTMLLKKLQEISQQAKTFITTPDGFKVTNPEGFVAVTAEGGAVKLVDRLEFSRQNFTMTKSFSKK